MKRAHPNASLALFLAFKRKQAKLDQREVAESIGRSQVWLSRVENGKIAPHPNDLKALTTALGLTEEEKQQLQNAF
jgi:transcriptional regulator with XRE-family HTH domain